MNLTKLKRLNEIMCEKHLFVWNIKKDSNMMATATIKLAELLPFSLLHRRRKWQPLQYSCLENLLDRGAWWVAVHRVTQSRTRLKQLNMHACIGEGNGNPLQYSCLENPRDRGAWWAAVYGVA